jgi:nitroreductase
MFIPLIQKRRSIRRFLKKPVEPEKIELLIEAALRAPSSRGLNPWEFIVVSDRELLKKLSKAKIHGSAFLKNAALGIVVCADPAKCDVWIEDTSIASIFIHLAAESIGLGSCWIQIRERMHNDTVTSEEYVSNTLNIPGNIKVESVIAIGYTAEQKKPHPKNALQYKKVHNNLFGIELK